jgi:short-subunit dehydrogenase
VLGVNLWGVIYGVRAFVPGMLERGDEGHVVNTASIAGLIAGAGGPAYSITKAGVISYSETLFHELGALSGRKIHVSVLCPALTNTRIIESGRNRPGGPDPEPAAGTQERAMLDMIKGIFAGGMPPSEVARQVFEAIQNERFYVLTHPEHNERYRMRLEAIIGGGPPPLLMPMPG